MPLSKMVGLAKLDSPYKKLGWVEALQAPILLFFVE
jgi:hypothetical protein